MKLKKMKKHRIGTTRCEKSRTMDEKRKDGFGSTGYVDVRNRKEVGKEKLSEKLFMVHGTTIKHTGETVESNSAARIESICHALSRTMARRSRFAV